MAPLGAQHGVVDHQVAALREGVPGAGVELVLPLDAARAVVQRRAQVQRGLGAVVAAVGGQLQALRIHREVHQLGAGHRLLGACRLHHRPRQAEAGEDAEVVVAALDQAANPGRALTFDGGSNAAQASRVLDALQTDKLCPCNWKKGDETLN